MTASSGSARVALAIGISIWALPARAEEPPSRPVADAIDVTGDTCFDKAELAAQIAGWLGRTSIDARIAVHVKGGASGGGRAGIVYTVTRSGTTVGERTLNLARAPCPEVRAAVGLGIAVAIDATVLESLGIRDKPPPSPALAPAPPIASAPSDSSSAPIASAGIKDDVSIEPPPPPLRPPVAERGEPPPPDAPEPLEVDQRKPWPGLAAGVEGVMLAGILPDLAVGVAPAMELRFSERFDLRASALVTTAVHTPVGVGTARVTLAAGRADGCLVLTQRRGAAPRLRTCGGFIAGVMSAGGAGFRDLRASQTPWLGPALRFDAAMGVGKLNIGLALEGFVPFNKPRFDSAGPNGEVAASTTLPPAGMALGLGPSITFW